jgi:hypothetical protein
MCGKNVGLSAQLFCSAYNLVFTDSKFYASLKFFSSLKFALYDVNRPCVAPTYLLESVLRGHRSCVHFNIVRPVFMVSAAWLSCLNRKRCQLSQRN